MPRLLRRVTCAAAAIFLVGTVGAPPATADAARSSQWYLSALGVQQAWQHSRGAGSSICVVDSGVDYQAPDLAKAVTKVREFSKPPQVYLGGHGTAVAGLAAARGRGSNGIIGVAPAASVLAAVVDVAADDSAAQIAGGIRWCGDQHAGVINLSIKAPESGGAQIAAAVRYAQSRDAVVVAASGDKFKFVQQLSALAALPGVVAVSGVDRGGRIDPQSTVGSGVALAAPFSTTPANARGVATTGLTVVDAGTSPHYYQTAGTSFSAPIVSGVVALIRAAHPDLDAANVINRLIRTATPAGGSTPNDTYGYGIVDAAKAVSASVPGVTANPLLGGPTSTPTSGTSTAPDTTSRTASAPTTGSTGPPTAPGTSSGPAASGGSSSGPGAGLWVGIAAAVLVVGAIVAILVTRRRPRRQYPPAAPR